MVKKQRFEKFPIDSEVTELFYKINAVAFILFNNEKKYYYILALWLKYFKFD